MKRTAKLDNINKSNKKRRIVNIDESLVKEFDKNFNEDSSNIVARNSVANVGPLMASTDPNEVNKISHVFLNTVKKKNIKATNQGYSGRCWMFSGLNSLRHSLIRALDLDNFEFSETYLYFWDKLERSNSFLQWFIDNLNNKYNVDDRFTQYMLQDFMSDGGYWNQFADLVDKYGLIPKSAMGETDNSSYSEEMNNIIIDRLHASVIRIHKIKQNNGSKDQLNRIKKKTLKQIYNVLVKCLGKPPKTFNWSFLNGNNNSDIIANLNPLKFKELVIPNLSMKEFIVLGNVPIKGCKLRQKYLIESTNNISNGSCCEFINLSSYDLKRYAKKSIISGFPVWFAADINKGFHPLYASLNDKVIDTDSTFGKPYKTTKGERLLFKNQEGNHAMTFTGVNIDEKNNSLNWQVENSWGYYDNETPGMDGFMSMDDKWFDEYVLQVVVHKNFLSKDLKKLIMSTPIKLQPWDGMAPAIRIKPNNTYKNYLKVK